jgi:hypothetical protein
VLMLVHGASWPGWVVRREPKEVAVDSGEQEGWVAAAAKAVVASMTIHRPPGRH